MQIFPVINILQKSPCLATGLWETSAQLFVRLAIFQYVTSITKVISWLAAQSFFTPLTIVCRDNQRRQAGHARLRFAVTRIKICFRAEWEVLLIFLFWCFMSKCRVYNADSVPCLVHAVECKSKRILASTPRTFENFFCIFGRNIGTVGQGFCQGSKHGFGHLLSSTAYYNASAAWNSRSKMLRMLWNYMLHVHFLLLKQFSEGRQQEIAAPSNTKCKRRWTNIWSSAIASPAACWMRLQSNKYPHSLMHAAIHSESRSFGGAIIKGERAY